jgi:hypothetical protein
MIDRRTFFGAVAAAMLGPKTVDPVPPYKVMKVTTACVINDDVDPDDRILGLGHFFDPE